MKGIGLRCKQARKAKKYSQDILAEKIGVSRGVIGNLEYERAEPQEIVISAICQALEINREWLVSGEGPMEAANRTPEVLEKIYDLSRQCSEEEQQYILEMIRLFQKHKGTVNREQKKSGGLGGIGTDIVEIARIEQAIEKPSFLEKIYTEEEISYYKEKGSHAETLAAFFAAKEAVVKAMGIGFRGILPKDISVSHDDLGKPEIVLSEKAKQVLAERGEKGCFLVSLSHDKNCAVAFVVWEK